MGNCPEGYEYDAGLCYPTCKPEYSGIGPVCWGNCPPNTSDIGAVCIKHSYLRNEGTIPICPEGTYKNGALCYPDCKSGYTGNGPVCWGVCPPDYPDHLVYCGKPDTSYGRGVGHWTEEGCLQSGSHGASTNGCELYYGLWYAKCDKGFHNYDCCVCTPDCPQGFSDDGATCAKPNYGNTVGTIPESCPGDKEYYLGLCYDKCKTGYSEFLTICLAVCSGETTNTGTQCQKDTYGRGAGEVPGLSPTEKYIIYGILIFIALVIIFSIVAAAYHFL
jgi:hypothetical protein